MSVADEMRKIVENHLKKKDANKNRKKKKSSLMDGLIAHWDMEKERELEKTGLMRTKQKWTTKNQTQ